MTPSASKNTGLQVEKVLERAAYAIAPSDSCRNSVLDFTKRARGLRDLREALLRRDVQGGAALLVRRRHVRARREQLADHLRAALSSKAGVEG